MYDEKYQASLDSYASIAADFWAWKLEEVDRQIAERGGIPQASSTSDEEPGRTYQLDPPPFDLSTSSSPELGSPDEDPFSLVSWIQSTILGSTSCPKKGPDDKVPVCPN